MPKIGHQKLLVDIISKQGKKEETFGGHQFMLYHGVMLF